MSVSGAHPAAELNDEQWSAVDDAVDRFSQLWNSDNRPEIAPFVPPPGDSIRARVLIELIKVDQEFRWRSGDPKILESYLDHWPELYELTNAKAELLQAECVTRAAAGNPPKAAELQRRFPDLSVVVLEGLLRAAELAHDDAAATLNLEPHTTPRNKLRIRCPHCHNPIDLPLDTALTDIMCSACGCHFSLVDHSKATRAAPLLTRMGRFELVERLGVGGFGSVWKARDKELDRTVAIKIPRHDAMTAEDQEKFLREARAAAQLRHSNIVSVHEVGRDGDSLYIVSDFVRGVTLAEWLTGQQLTDREAADLCAKIADALHHAHDQGVVHRDLKPANIMIDMTGQPHLMDFGLARREVGEITMTLDGQVLGTPAYMSPEQAQGEAHTADRRSDVYSLGVILFQLLTGELPFRGVSRMIMYQVIHDEPPSPRKLRPNISRDLETITLKCMEKPPSRRYPTADELATDLRRYLAGEPILARPVGPIERAWRWARRKPAVAALSSAVAVALVSGTAVSLYFAGSAREQARLALAREQDAIAAKYEADALRADAEKRLEAEQLRAEEERARKSAEAATEYVLYNDPGHLSEAIPFFQGTLDATRKRLGADHLDTLTAMTDLARAYADAENFDEALLLYKDIADTTQRIEWDRVHNRTLSSIHQLAHKLQKADKIDAAIALFKASRNARAKLDGEEDDGTIGYTDCLISACQGAGRINQLLSARSALANSYKEAKKLDKAIAAYKQVLEGWRTEVDTHPDAESGRHLAVALVNLCDVSVKAKDFATGREYANEALAILSKLTADVSDSAEDLGKLAACHSKFALVLRELGDHAAAVDEFQQASESYSNLIAKSSTNSEYRQSFAWSCYHFANWSEEHERFAEAAPYLEKAVEILTNASAEFPKETDNRLSLGGMCCNMGGLLKVSGEPAAALPYLDRAEEALKSVLAETPNHQTARQYLRNTYWRRAETLDQLQRHEAAAANWEMTAELDAAARHTEFQIYQATSLARAGRASDAVQLVESAIKADESALAPKDHYNAACVLAICLRGTLEQSDNKTRATGDIDESAEEQWANRAVELLIRAQKTGYFNNSDNMKSLTADGDFSALRARPEFEAFRTTLHAEPAAEQSDSK